MPNQSVTKTSQGEIRSLIEKAIPTAEALTKPIRVKINGYDQTFDFSKIRGVIVRGVTLLVQATERPKAETVKNLNSRIEDLEERLKAATK